MNRRFLALALAGTLSLSLLAGCGSSKEPAPESSAPVVESPSASPEASPSPVLPTDSPAALPETTPPAEETPSQAPSAAPSAKPSAPAATPKPTQKPTSTPTPEPVEPEPQVDAVQSTWNDISKLDIPSLTDLDDATLTALYGIDPAGQLSLQDAHGQCAGHRVLYRQGEGRQDGYREGRRGETAG